MDEPCYETRTGRARGRQRKADVRPQADGTLGHGKQGTLRDHAHLRHKPMPLRLCLNHERNAAAAAINCGLVGFTNIEAYRGSQAKWPRSLRSSCQDCKCRKELMKTHRRACGECEAWTWPAYCRAPRAPCQGPPHAAPPRAARGKACSGEAHGEARTSPCTARPTPRPIQMPSHSAA